MSSISEETSVTKAEEEKIAISSAKAIDLIQEFLEKDVSKVAMIDTFRADPAGTFLFDPSEDDGIMDVFIATLDEFPKLVYIAVKNILRNSWTSKIPIDKALKDFRVKITSGNKIKFGELRARNANTPVSFDAIVLMEEKMQSYPKEAVYTCMDCNGTSKRSVDPLLKVLPKEKCSNEDCPSFNKPMTIHPNTVKAGDYKRIILQEPLEESTMGNPRILEAELRDDDAHAVYLGQRVRFVGIYRPMPETLKTVNDVLVQIISATPAQQVSAIMPNDDEIKKFKQFIHHDKGEENLIDSYAPHIWGERLVKFAILLYRVRGNTIMYEGTKLRGIINLFLIGDPGTSKTKLMQWLANVSQSFAYANGRMASGAGMTISLDKIDGRQMPRIGPALMYEEFGIDEMGRTDPEELSALHQLMEDGAVTLAKGGYYITQRKETAVIGAANPRHDYYDDEYNLVWNAQLPATILSRFSVIINMRDKPDSLEDGLRTDHILNVRRKKFKRRNETLSPEELLKYLNYARTLEPELSDDAEKLIRKFYLNLRGIDTKGDKVADRRMLEDMIRISTAIAKLDLENIVTIKHAERCMKFFEDMYGTFNKSIRKEERQAGLIFSKQDALIKVFDSLEAAFKKPYISGDLVVEALFKEYQHLFNTETEATDFFEKCEKANMFEKHSMKYRLIR